MLDRLDLLRRVDNQRLAARPGFLFATGIRNSAPRIEGGLCDLGRKPRAVGRACQRLIAQWDPVPERQGHRLGMLG